MDNGYKPYEPHEPKIINSNKKKMNDDINFDKDYDDDVDNVEDNWLHNP